VSRQPSHPATGVLGCLPALAGALEDGVVPDAAALERFLAAQVEAGLVHGSRPLCRVLSPLVVTVAVYRRVARAAELLLSAMERLVARALVDDELVLKPNEEYGGRGVVLGWTADAASWDAALARGVSERAVLQERVRVRRLRFPSFDDRGVRWRDLAFDLNPFLFRGRMEGAMVRVSDGPVSNVSAGGGVTGLVVLDDAEECAASV